MYYSSLALRNLQKVLIDKHPYPRPRHFMPLQYKGVKKNEAVVDYSCHILYTHAWVLWFGELRFIGDYDLKPPQ